MAVPFQVTVVITLIRVVSFVFESLMLPLYAIMFRPISYMFRARRRKAYSSTGHPSGPYRSSELSPQDPLIHTFDGFDSLVHMWLNSRVAFAELNCMGTREYLGEEDEIQPNGRVFKKLVLGEYRWQTYAQVAAQVDKMSAALRKLGVRQGDRVAILADTRAEWMITALACFLEQAVAVTLYPTLGEDGIVHGLSEVWRVYFKKVILCY